MARVPIAEEQERIKAGPRFKGREGRKPAPIIEEAPPVTAPKPPPTLEPVIPQPVID